MMDARYKANYLTSQKHTHQAAIFWNKYSFTDSWKWNKHCRALADKIKLHNTHQYDFYVSPAGNTPQPTKHHHGQRQQLHRSSCSGGATNDN